MRNNSYMLRMTDEQAARAAETLGTLGVEFDPPSELIWINEKSSKEYHLSGSDAGDLIDLMNKELQENGVTPLLPERQGNLTLTQTLQLFDLAWLAFDWDDDEIFSMSSQASTQKQWQDLADARPEIFAAD